MKKRPRIRKFKSSEWGKAQRRKGNGASAIGRNGVKHNVAGSNDGQGAEIAFYRANEQPYGALSNLYKRSIIFEGAEFPTAEHAYQAGKAVREKVRKWLLNAPTPALLAMAAHGLYTWDVVPNWSEIKYERMHRVLYAKFSQHPDLKQLLLETGSARLVERGRVANAVNKTWGEVNGKGLNMLGRLLMEVRSQLQAEASTGSPSPRRAQRSGKRVSKRS